MAKLYNIYAYRIEGMECAHGYWRLYCHARKRGLTKEEVAVKLAQWEGRYKSSVNPADKVLVYEAGGQAESAFLAKVAHNERVCRQHNERVRETMDARNEQRLAEVRAMRKQGYVVRDYAEYCKR